MSHYTETVTGRVAPKGTMVVQSTIAPALFALVVARAVNAFQ